MEHLQAKCRGRNDAEVQLESMRAEVTQANADRDELLVLVAELDEELMYLRQAVGDRRDGDECVNGLRDHVSTTTELEACHHRPEADVTAADGSMAMRTATSVPLFHSVVPEPPSSSSLAAVVVATPPPFLGGRGTALSPAVSSATSRGTAAGDDSSS